MRRVSRPRTNDRRKVSCDSLHFATFLTFCSKIFSSVLLSSRGHKTWCQSSMKFERLISTFYFPKTTFSPLRRRHGSARTPAGLRGRSVIHSKMSRSIAAVRFWLRKSSRAESRKMGFSPFQKTACASKSPTRTISTISKRCWRLWFQVSPRGFLRLHHNSKRHERICTFVAGQ